MKKTFFDNLSQFCIPIFTLSAQVALALKHPELSLVLNLIAQPFWLYSSYQAYRHVGQIGMFLNTIAFGLITVYGIINYFVK